MVVAKLCENVEGQAMDANWAQLLVALVKAR
jgi:hypothetical protein